ncbi:hypothetical protein LINPERPRIM_LOCUS19075 [Linum perenne]
MLLLSGQPLTLITMTTQSSETSLPDAVEFFC